MIVLAAGGHSLWAIVLAISFGAAILLAVMLTLLVEYVRTIESSIEGLTRDVSTLAEVSQSVPQLGQAVPALAQLADELDQQDDKLTGRIQASGGA